MSTITLTEFRVQDLPAGAGWAWACGDPHPVAVITDADLLVDVVGTHVQDGPKWRPMTLDELREHAVHKMRSLIEVSLGLEGVALRYDIEVRISDNELDAAHRRAL